MKKLNFLLVMPRFVASVGDSYNFQLGIACISAVMKQAGFNVFTLNLNHIEGEIGEILSEEITNNKIDVVLAGGISGQYRVLKNIIDCVHNKFPQILIIIGGGIITADPEVSMTALEYADVGVIGEGEETVNELCNALQALGMAGGGWHQIAGIIYRDNGSWIQTKRRKEIADLDALPMPDYDGFELDKYLELPGIVTSGSKGSRAFFVTSSRSCPYLCTFCLHTTGRKYRQRDLGIVAKEIEVLVEKYNVGHIFLLDELFAREKKRVKRIDDISKKLGITWNASFRVDDVDEELIEMLKNSNCTNMRVGLESADNRILKSMRKHTTIEQIETALQLAYDAGVQTNGDFIFGDIEETSETANVTLDWWAKHKQYGINAAFIIVFPGTHLYKYALENKIIKDPVRFLKDGCPHINVSKMNDDEFSAVAKRMLSLSAQTDLKLANMRNIRINDKGKMSFDGECIKCGKKQSFDDVPMFYLNNWAFCTSCSQKYDIQLPQEMAQLIVEHLQEYFGGSKKFALWEIIPSSLLLFESNDFFESENIVFIDNSPIKQRIIIHGKKVCSPDELLTSGIDTAIYFHSYSYAAMADRVRQEYSGIKHFINVCDLLAKSNSFK